VKKSPYLCRPPRNRDQSSQQGWTGRSGSHRVCNSVLGNNNHRSYDLHAHSGAAQDQKSAICLIIVVCLAYTLHLVMASLCKISHMPCHRRLFDLHRRDILCCSMRICVDCQRGPEVDMLKQVRIPEPSIRLCIVRATTASR
jgi:hypothetical protein